MSPKRTPETALKVACTRLIKQLGGYSMPIAAGPFSPPGLPDRIVFFKGHAYAVEFKSPKGKLGPKQEMVRRLIEGCGCKYILCRSPDDLLTGLGVETLFQK